MLQIPTYVTVTSVVGFEKRRTSCKIVIA